MTVIRMFPRSRQVASNRACDRTPSNNNAAKSNNAVKRAIDLCCCASEMYVYWTVRPCRNRTEFATNSDPRNNRIAMQLMTLRLSDASVSRDIAPSSRPVQRSVLVSEPEVVHQVESSSIISSTSSSIACNSSCTITMTTPLSPSTQRGIDKSDR